MNYPVKKVYITQEWGVNPQIYGSLGLKGHNGIDLRIYDTNGNKAVSGELLAPHDGKIIEAALDTNGYGWYYKIENDVEGSILGHNKQLLFKVGDTVKEGWLIAYTDNTGWSTGAHVHWGYYRKPRNKADGYSGTIDPRPFIKPNQEGTMTELEVCLAQHKELVTKLDNQDKIIAEITADKDRYKSERDQARSERDNYVEENKGLSTQIELLKKDIAALNNDLEEYQNQATETPSVEEYTKGFAPTGRTISQVQGDLTISTTYKVKE